MKSFFTLMLSVLFLNIGYAQPDSFDVYSTFDIGDTAWVHHFFIDTQSHQNNIWQVGRPNKTLFDSAYSSPNVIVTDTLNPYPANDTSVFVLKFLGYAPCGNCIVNRLEFRYQLNIDSGETAMIELSTDSGQHWATVTSDTFNVPDFSSDGPLHDTSNWTRYTIMFPPMQFYGEYYLRFTFISDSINTNKAGWEMDNFWVDYQGEGYVSPVRKQSQMKVYPNPSNGLFYLKDIANKSTGAISVFTINGKKVFETVKKEISTILDLQLPNGLYILKYATNQGVDVSPIVINK